MTEQDYKDILRLLRRMTERTVELKDNGLVSESDIAPILHYGAAAEELITAAYIS